MRILFKSSTIRMSLLFLCITLMHGGKVLAKDDPFRSTAYPIPRFVSLGSSKVNVRTGPGAKYPIKWVYRQKFLPIEVILEFDAWRKIRDQDGAIGWVHGSLISGRRFGVVQGESLASVFSKPQLNSGVRLRLEPGVRLGLDECHNNWCKVKVAETRGWVLKNLIWGVYPNEKFN